MVTEASKAILNAYWNFRGEPAKATAPTTRVTGQGKPTTVSPVVQENRDVSEEHLENVSDRLEQVQGQINQKENNWKTKNPHGNPNQMDSGLRKYNDEYRHLLDERDNLKQQQFQIQEKVDFNREVQQSQQDRMGIDMTVQPMDRTPENAAPEPMLPRQPASSYNTMSGEVGVSQGGQAIDPNSDQGQTIQAIYDRQAQDRIDNAVQSNHFWQLREGKVPIGEALFNPQTKNTYYSGGEELSQQANLDKKMELTQKFLEKNNQSFDTPIGNVKTSPTRYTEARSRATESELQNMIGINDQMGDLNQLAPNQTKEGDFTGYIAPDNYRKRITTSSPSEFPLEQGNWEVHPTGYGRTYALTEEIEEITYGKFGIEYTKNQYIIPTHNMTVATTGLMSFENTIPDESKVIMGYGNIPSMLGGINLFTDKKKNSVFTTPPVSDVVNSDIPEVPKEAQRDWLGGDIESIPDDPWQQLLKGGSAEAFNIGQTIRQVTEGEEQKFAPSLIGDTMDAMASGTVEHKDYTDDWGANIGIWAENTGKDLNELATNPEVQREVGESFGEMGERMQKYPVYYIASGITEIGSMILPVGKVSTALKVGSKEVIAATRQSVKTKSIDPFKEALKSTDKKVVEIAQSFAPDMSVKLLKVKGTKMLFIEKIVKNNKFMPQFTTKTKTMVQNKLKIKSGKVKIEKKVISNDAAKIEKIGDKQYLVNLGEGQSGKGYGWAIIDLKQGKTGIVMKEFKELKEAPLHIKKMTTKQVTPQQLGDIHWFDNALYKDKSFKKQIQYGKKEATEGIPLEDPIMKGYTKTKQYTNEPVYSFLGGKPSMPSMQFNTKYQMLKMKMQGGVFNIGGKSLVMGKNYRKLFKRTQDKKDAIADRGENPLIHGDITVEGIPIKASPESTWNTGLKELAISSAEARQAAANAQRNTGKKYWRSWKKDFGDEGADTSKGKGSGGSGSGGGSGKVPNPNANQSGNQFTTLVNAGGDGLPPNLKGATPMKGISPYTKIGKEEIEEMAKIKSRDAPPQTLGSLIPFGMPLAFAQTAQVAEAAQPAQRIGTNNLYISAEVTPQKQSNYIPTKMEPPKLKSNTEQRVRQSTGQSSQLDVVAQTAQVVTSLGIISTGIGGGTNPTIMMPPEMKLKTPLKQNQMFAPKVIHDTPKPKKVRPTGFMPPAYTIIPQQPPWAQKKKPKKKRGKKSKIKSATFATPDVWFDAKGYYYKGGAAYVIGDKPNLKSGTTVRGKRRTSKKKKGSN